MRSIIFLTKAYLLFRRSIYYILIIILLILSIAYTAYGQQQEVPIRDPRVESFTIFGEIPVSHSTGVPDISIPLFNIVSHGYELPVTLKYHPGLVKPPYDHTNIATGWTLVAGGSISQNMKAENDFLEKRPDNWMDVFALHDQWDTEVQRYINLVSLGAYDTEYDLFSYSFPHSSGKFILTENPVDNKLKFTFLSDPLHSGVLVNFRHPIENTYELDAIHLKDADGHTYIYPDNYDYQDYLPSKSRPQSTKFLKQILSPSGHELFNFSYSKFSFNLGSFYYNWDVVINHSPSLDLFDMNLYDYDCGQNASPACTGNWTCTDIFPSGSGQVQKIASSAYSNVMRGLTVERINYDNGHLEFTLSADRTHIEKAILYDLQNNVVKGYNFVYDYFPGEGYRYLRKVVALDKNQIQVNEFSFSYYNQQTPVLNENIHTDYWGFLNGNNPDGIKNYIDIQKFTYVLYDCYLGRDRVIGAGYKYPVLNYAKTYVLQSITYPTGGKTEFDYELHRKETEVTNTTKYYGGLRISNIKNFGTDGERISAKEYKYGEGKIVIEPQIESNNSSIQVLVSTRQHPVGTYISTTFGNSLINPILGNNMPFYSLVTEFNKSLEGEDIGKTEYIYEYLNPHVVTNIIDYDALFDDVPDYLQASNFDAFLLSDLNYQYIKDYRDWGNGTLKKRIFYKRESDLYLPIKEEEYKYDFVTSGSYQNLKLYRLISYHAISGQSLSRYYALRNDADRYDPRIPRFNNPYIDPVVPYAYYIKTGTYKLTSKVTKENIRAGESLKSVENYIFDNGLGQQMTRQVSILSDGSERETEFTYPIQYRGLSPYSEMIENNILNPVVNQKTYLKKGGARKLLNEQKLNYKDWGNNVIKPVSIEKYNMGALSQLQSLKFDAEIGNLLEVVDNNGVPTCYIWGYFKNLPIAKVVNASFDKNGNLIDKTDPAKVFTYFQIADLQNHMGSIESFLSKFEALRSALPNCPVTTYTYDPMAGMTSKTDPNGFTTHYNFDDAGRLEFIKDHESNILQTYKYNYQIP